MALDPVSIKSYRILPKSGEHAIRKPASVTGLADGTSVLLDGKTGQIHFVSPDGRTFSLGSEGNSLAARGDILFVSEDKRILRYNKHGELLGVLADRKTVPFSNLRGMAFDARGNLYVADAGRDLIFIISPDGLALGSIGADEPKEAQLNKPTDVALDHLGNVFILDYADEHIVVYTTSNHYRRTIEGMDEPISITSDKNGLLYVADRDEYRVTRYDAEGNVKGGFGAKGKNRAQFKGMIDLDFGADGLLRVVDNKNRSFHELEWPYSASDLRLRPAPLSARRGKTISLDGTIIGAMSNGDLIIHDASGDLHVRDKKMRLKQTVLAKNFKDPVAATGEASGRIYVADKSAGEIKVFDKEGQKLFSFGQGSRVYFFRGGNGKLVKPIDVAISSAGVIAVADVDKVELYGPDGSYLSPVGTSGKDPGGIRRPIAVAFGKDGAIYVADASNERLTKFDATGNYAGVHGNGIEPLALVSDPEGRIYVLDENGPRIRVFSEDLQPILTIGTEGWDIKELSKSLDLVLAGDVAWIQKRKNQVTNFRLDLPLPAPKNVEVAEGARNVKLSWDVPTLLPVKSYLVKWDGDSTYSSSAEIDILGLFEETDYQFEIWTVNSLGNLGDFAKTVVAKTRKLSIDAPGAPHIMFSSDLAEVRIKWDKSSSKLAARYRIEGKDDDEYHEVAETKKNSISIPSKGWSKYRIIPLTEDGKEGTPSSARNHYAAQGLVSMQAKDFRSAADRLWKASKDEPANSHIWKALGRASEELERFSEAVKAYSKAKVLAPRDTPVLVALARIAVMRNETERAEEYVKGIQNRYSRDEELLYVQGIIDLNRQRFDSAVQILASAVSLDPSRRNRKALDRALADQQKFGRNRPRLEIVSAHLQPIFPALYKDYQTREIGSAIVKNSGDAKLEGLRFAVFIRGAMDFPSDQKIDVLEPGETTEIRIRADLSNSILDITEDDTKQAELRLTYFMGGEPVVVKRTIAFRMYARTALVWDEPSKIASFVTVRDPGLADWAREVATFIADESDVSLRAVRYGILFHDALDRFGLRYIEDPINPYSKVSENLTVDHVQLPEETLRRKSGDCDDLVVLYAPLFENLGVRVAIVDLPGHILLMLDTELPVEYASQLGLGVPWREYEGTVWLPFETTLTGGAFLDAVKAGADVIGSQTPVIALIDRAWIKYPPVTTQVSSWRAAVPAKAAIRKEYVEQEKIWRRSRANALVANLENIPGIPEEGMENQAGIIFAKFGFLEDARLKFVKYAKSAAALNNAANISMLEDNAAQALEQYTRASSSDPDDVGIQENVKRAKAEMKQ